MKNNKKNLIFFDAEFNGLSATGTTLLSMGFVREVKELAPVKNPRAYTHAQDGEYKRNPPMQKVGRLKTLYLELELPEDIDPWVKENILPHLTGETVSADEAKQKIRDFVGPDKPHLVADVNQFDWMGICGLFGIFRHPFHYIPIDFASILWVKGIDPDIDRYELCQKYGIPTKGYKKHNALDDAMILKTLYDRVAC